MEPVETPALILTPGPSVDERFAKEYGKPGEKLTVLMKGPGAIETARLERGFVIALQRI